MCVHVENGFRLWLLRLLFNEPSQHRDLVANGSQSQQQADKAQERDDGHVRVDAVAICKPTAISRNRASTSERTDAFADDFSRAWSASPRIPG